jgi:hypothetical protein
MDLPIVVRLEDGRYGLLTVNLDIAFTGTSGFYELDAIGKADAASQDGGHAHYSDHQFVLPQDLRKHIFLLAMRSVVSTVSYSLGENNRDDNQVLRAYMFAEVLLKPGPIGDEEITYLVEDLEDLNFDEENDEKTIPILQGLACEYRKLWPHGMHAEQRQSGSGRC